MSNRITLSFIVLFCGTAAFAQQIPDSELKSNIAPLENSLEYIRKLEPKTYEYNLEAFGHLGLPKGPHFGFIAEELEQVLPESVGVRHHRYAAGKNSSRTAKVKDVDMESLIPVLVAAIKEQQTEIERLKKQVAESSAPGMETGKKETCSSCGGSCG
ncbi:MAG TPA: tail fiber domain-containing protein [Anseongella sp.]|nr:tail fiber domain-containing protein [Anseongella sp.]